ncbi:MAG: PEP-CTERM sorting domain-containing protein [Planctomycetota bacterium]|nr:PEP-CTERM sorting domain-containing protein [Planctomycetota bacterium]
MSQLIARVGRMLMCVLAVLVPAAMAGATLTLEGDEVTSGVPIVYSQDVLLGNPPEITLRTTLGGNPGANISFMAAVNDDAGPPTSLSIDAGTAGIVTLLGNVGEVTPISSLTIISAALVNLNGVRTNGPGGFNVGGTPGGINLGGNLATNGAAIVIQNNVVLGLPAMITLDSSGGGGGGGGAITLNGTVNDDVLSATTLVLKAGAGNVTLQGAVGGLLAPAGLTIASANQASLAAVTTAGPISVTATKLTVNGAMASGGFAVTLNAGTIDLKALIKTGGGALTGNAATVNVTTAASIQNAVDVATTGAILNVDGGTYDESVTIAKNLTANFGGDSTITQTLSINGAVGLGGAATYLSLHALSITNECSLDVGAIPLYVDGDVESTLDGWITDGRLLSSDWGSAIDAAYVSSLGRTEVTPEPATLSLLALGGLALLRRSRRK